MELKRYTKYQINFDSKWISACGALMGLSFFLRIVYYFGLKSLRDVGFIELFTSAIAGIVLCGAMVVFLICLRRNAPGLYGMIGAALCLSVLIASFTTGSPVRIILAIVWYALTALILIGTVGGYLPGRMLAGLMFAIAALVRLLFYDFGHLGLISWVRELGVLSMLASLGCLPMGLEPMVKRK